MEDSEARQMAIKALTKIEEHERTCGDRWAQANRSLERLGDAVDLIRGVQNKRWWILFGVLLAAVGSDAASLFTAVIP